MNDKAQALAKGREVPAVIGNFLFGAGARAAAYVRDKAPGFAHVTAIGDAIAATSGAVRVGTADGCLQLLLGDLVVAEGEDPLAWRGRFVLLRYDPSTATTRAWSDHFASLPIYCSLHGEDILVCTDLRMLLDCPWLEREADPVAIDHYLNFAYIPAPWTLLAGVRRLAPASRVEFAAGRTANTRYWRPPYQEDLDGDADALAAQLRERIVATVQRYRPAGDDGWGCFLSGGTDSSSVTTILARQHPGRDVHAFSIGFAEGGYDELEYARAAAAACGARSHSRLVGHADSMALLPALLDICDQPFGNASTIPTYACTRLAADEGVHLLLAGDGGDEIFGGNERYAKDYWFDRFHRLPGPIRGGLRALGAVAGRSHALLAQRMHNFVERGSLPNPDRFYTDDAFASESFAALYQPDFAARLRADASRDFLREEYAQSPTRSEIHRLMALDLDFAIARCDLVKVHGASRQAGVGVRYPFLDVDLVEFTGRLQARWKVDGPNKRVLFKRAMAPILPAEILRKRKQGFGLPVAVWLKQDEPFRALVRDTLLGERARARGWIRPPFVESLLREHEAGSWDWSSEIWRMLVLELWMEKYLDR